MSSPYCDGSCGFPVAHTMDDHESIAEYYGLENLPPGRPEIDPNCVSRRPLRLCLPPDGSLNDQGYR